MWTCAKCSRIFHKSNQPHSCKSVPLDSLRVNQTVPLSGRVYKVCIDISSKREVDDELMEWLGQAYALKEVVS